MIIRRKMPRAMGRTQTANFTGVRTLKRSVDHVRRMMVSRLPADLSTLAIEEQPNIPESAFPSVAPSFMGPPPAQRSALDAPSEEARMPKDLQALFNMHKAKGRLEQEGSFMDDLRQRADETKKQKQAAVRHVQPRPENVKYEPPPMRRSVDDEATSQNQADSDFPEVVDFTAAPARRIRTSFEYVNVKSPDKGAEPEANFKTEIDGDSGASDSSPKAEALQRTPTDTPNLTEAWSADDHWQTVLSGDYPALEHPAIDEAPAMEAAVQGQDTADFSTVERPSLPHTSSAQPPMQRVADDTDYDEPAPLQAQRVQRQPEDHWQETLDGDFPQMETPSERQWTDDVGDDTGFNEAPARPTPPVQRVADDTGYDKPAPLQAQRIQRQPEDHWQETLDGDFPQMETPPEQHWADDAGFNEPPARHNPSVQRVADDTGYDEPAPLQAQRIQRQPEDHWQETLDGDFPQMETPPEQHWADDAGDNAGSSEPAARPTPPVQRVVDDIGYDEPAPLQAQRIQRQPEDHWQETLDGDFPEMNMPVEQQWADDPDDDAGFSEPPARPTPPVQRIADDTRHDEPAPLQAQRIQRQPEDHWQETLDGDFPEMNMPVEQQWADDAAGGGDNVAFSESPARHSPPVQRTTGEISSDAATQARYSQPQTEQDWLQTYLDEPYERQWVEDAPSGEGTSFNEAPPRQTPPVQRVADDTGYDEPAPPQAQRIQRQPEQHWQETLEGDFPQMEMPPEQHWAEDDSGGDDVAYSETPASYTPPVQRAENEWSGYDEPAPLQAQRIQRQPERHWQETLEGDFPNMEMPLEQYGDNHDAPVERHTPAPLPVQRVARRDIQPPIQTRRIQRQPEQHWQAAVGDTYSDMDSGDYARTPKVERVQRTPVDHWQETLEGDFPAMQPPVAESHQQAATEQWQAALGGDFPAMQHPVDGSRPAMQREMDETAEEYDGSVADEWYYPEMDEPDRLPTQPVDLAQALTASGFMGPSAGSPVQRTPDPDSGLLAALGMAPNTPIQREGPPMPSTSTSAIQRAELPPNRSEIGGGQSESQNSSNERGEDEHDRQAVENMARKVYRILQRRFRIEVERERGR
ncbi:MAG: hypothetical protein H6673_09710 [Anaerolineales bacterium]|nr:hypothetical protein [Anaerolineales bacterium]